jgi:hypothetical protein
MISDLDKIKEDMWELHRKLRDRLQELYKEGDDGLQKAVAPMKKKDDGDNEEDNEEKVDMDKVRTRRTRTLNTQSIIFIETCLLHFYDYDKPFRWGEIDRALPLSMKQNLDTLPKFCGIALKMGFLNLVGKKISDIKNIRDIFTSRFELSEDSKIFVKEYYEEFSKFNEKEEKLSNKFAKAAEKDIQETTKRIEKENRYEQITIGSAELFPLNPAQFSYLSKKAKKTLPKLKSFLIKKLNDGPVLRIEFLRLVNEKYSKPIPQLGLIVTILFRQMVQTGKYVPFSKLKYKGIVKKGISIEEINDFLENISTFPKSSTKILLGIKKKFIEEISTGKEVFLNQFQEWSHTTYADSGLKPGTLNYHITAIINDVRRMDPTISRIRHGSKISYKKK